MDQGASLGSARVVLWDPRGSNRFVVGGGSELKLFEWENNLVKQVGLRGDLQAMRCFAWSPHSVYNDLLAIGLAHGVVDICRLDNTLPNLNGSFPATQVPVSLSISARNRRPCTSLAFCGLNPNLLASGLDKFRTEYSLVIWDLEQSAPVFEASAIDDHFDRLTGPLPNPAGYPTRMGRGTLHPRSSSSSSTMPGGRVGNDVIRVPSRGKSAYQKNPQDNTHPSGQYCEGEGINSCVFLHQSSWEVVAGVNNRLMRYFDLRVRTKAVRDANTKAVRGICCDPMGGYLLSSLDEVGVHVWDRRKHTQPVMVFQEEDAGLDPQTFLTSPTTVAPPQGAGRITGVEFCNTRRNVLGTITREGCYVRLWNLIDGEPYGDDANIRDDYSESTNPQQTSEWASHGTWGEQGTTPSDGRRQASVDDGGLVLSSTKRSKIFKTTIASFDFIPRSATPHSAPYVVTVNKVGSARLFALRDSPRHQWSPRGDLAASVGQTYKIIHTHVGFSGDPAMEPWYTPYPADYDETNKPGPVESAEVEQSTEGQKRDDLLSVQQLEPARRISPSSVVRASYERKPGPGSSISTPRPNLTPLESDDAINLKRQEVVGSNTKTPNKPNLSKTRPSRKPDLSIAEKGLAQDISTLIRRRVLQGYGLDSAKYNGEIVRDDPGAGALSEIWQWLHNSNKLLQADVEDAFRHIHGFDFVLKGVQPIWEGFKPLQRISSEPPNQPTQWRPVVQRGQRRGSSALSATAPRGFQDAKFGHYPTAVEWLNKRNRGKATIDMIMFPRSSQRKPQRELGLALVGWNYTDAELNQLIRSWEKDRAAGRAACWAAFMGNVKQGIDILSHSHDERHRLLSAVMATGLHLQSTPDSEAYSQWRDRCQTLVTRLDDPYARILLTWFITKDWRETIQDVPIPLAERIGIALRFFDDGDVSDFLREKIKEASTTGELEALMLTGMSHEGAIAIIQSYVDQTGDVQTAAVLSALAPKLYVQDKRSQRQRGIGPQVDAFGPNPVIAAQIEGWFEAYSELLDQWRLFRYRALFDIDKGQHVSIAMSPRQACKEADGSSTGEMVKGTIEPVEWIPRQIEIRCTVCGTSIGAGGPKSSSDAPNTATVAACPQCGVRLPRCTICRQHMSFPGEPVDQLLHNPVLHGRHCLIERRTLRFCRHFG